MRFRQRVVNLEGAQSRGPGLWQRLTRRGTGVFFEQCITVGQSCVGKCISRVFTDRLLKLLDCFLQSVGGPAVPIVTALEMELMGPCISGLAPAELLLLFASQLGAQPPEISREISCCTASASASLRLYCSPQICLLSRTSINSAPTIRLSPRCSNPA